MIEIAGFTLIERDGRQALEGQTSAGVECTGFAREYELTDDADLRLTIRGSAWANGERDVMASERHASPERFDTLIGRMRLSVLPHPIGQYVELQQARRRGARAQTFRAELDDLDAAAAVDCSTTLLRAGATAVGTRAELLGDAGRRREYLAATFAEGDALVPLVAYVLTRVAPVAAGVNA